MAPFTKAANSAMAARTSRAVSSEGMGRASLHPFDLSTVIEVSTNRAIGLSARFAEGDLLGRRPYAGNLRRGIDPALADGTPLRRGDESDGPARPVRAAAGGRAARPLGVRPRLAR